MKLLSMMFILDLILFTIPQLGFTHCQPISSEHGLLRVLCNIAQKVKSNERSYLMFLYSVYSFSGPPPIPAHVSHMSGRQISSTVIHCEGN